jgi:phage shock protein PspC (stress-responsive transcriptional regulator)
MKKNISINLQGMIFHIEEDGYEQLSQYLAAIKTYFSSYKGHEEIIADIEARIAEIFYAKLSPTKQVITREDVQALIAQMGSVADFQRIEEEEEQEQAHTYAGTGPEQASGQAYQQASTSKRIYSDQSRKVVGGVAAGIANYLNTDPLWIRLFLVFLVLIAPVTAGISAGVVVIAYLLCWLAFPKSYSLPETSSKKLFRDPRDKKLGGVASGMAYFFGTDVAVIRLLFLISVFLGGFGIIAYIVLWIIVPEASSITDQAQMQGNPVTLSGIEESLKNNLRMRDENGQESTLARIILFPVRLIAQVLQFLASILKPLLGFLVVLIRVFAGVLLLLIGGAIIFALMVMAFTALGIVDGSSVIHAPADMPLSVFVNSFPGFGTVAGFFAILIPCLFLLLVGLGLLLKRFYLSAATGWSIFGIWILSLFVLTLAIIDFSNDFREQGEFTAQKNFPVAPYPTVTLKTRDSGEHWGDTRLEIQGYSGPDVRLLQTFEAKGLTESEAMRNAGMISHRSIQQDSVITLDNNFKYKPDAIFRDQELHLKLLLPENKRFRLSREFSWMAGSGAFDQEYNTPNQDDFDQYLWQVKNNKLVCLNCPPPDTTDQEMAEDQEPGDWEEDGAEISSPLLEEEEYKGENRSFDLNDFNQVRVSGAYHVRIRRGDAYSVVARGRDRQLRNLLIRRDGNQLIIRPERNIFDLRFRDGDDQPVLITMVLPELRRADLSGAVKADIAGFNNPDFTLSASGAVESVATVNSRNVRIDATGACQTTLAGSGEHLEIEGTGACEIRATRFRATHADVELTGASNARVYVTGRLNAEVAGPSHVTYRGNPQVVNADESGIGRVEKE